MGSTSKIVVNLFFCYFTVTIPKNFETVYLEQLTSENPTFSHSGRSEQFHYQAIRLPITKTGVYIIRSNAMFDSYGFLYRSSFDPSKPLANLMAEDNNSDLSLDFRMTSKLQAGTTYILVVTTYNPMKIGVYELSLIGPAKINLSV